MIRTIELCIGVAMFCTFLVWFCQALVANSFFGMVGYAVGMLISCAMFVPDD